ncbi:peptide chain release factor-like protein [Geomonas sp.]|uniref:peptide chain release factor family protein n=1 Tax=Geomonas sp. TaxID=2651584 RepID=UPI002B45E740|nr:peptide chain release factor-like protein [Geomonas sp.]HJV36968.1 peptide chain release factor-like protein [Geomonas sp.]
MADFAVSEEKNRWLKTRMELLGVSEADLEERFVHASGRGGQHVNKGSSCVYLKHLPSGLEVKCMESRSQSLNRFLARRYLLEKVEALSGALTKKDIAAEKLRRQKARRKRRSGAKYAAAAGETHPHPPPPKGYGVQAPVPPLEGEGTQDELS